MYYGQNFRSRAEQFIDVISLLSVRYGGPSTALSTSRDRDRKVFVFIIDRNANRIVHVSCTTRGSHGRPLTMRALIFGLRT
jgi:hypothetical protein